MFGRKKRERRAVMNEMWRTYREKADEGEGILSSGDDGTIHWEFEGAHFDIVLPEASTSGVGLLQSVREGENDLTAVKRFYFTSDGLVDVFGVILTQQELETGDADMIDLYQSMRSEKERGVVSQEDMAEFFEALFAPLNDGVEKTPDS
jgi:hypothetical protein